jgi:hypothetical protein
VHGRTSDKLVIICLEISRVKLPALLVIAIAIVMASCRNTIECIDFDHIDTLRVCPKIYSPVCGCDNFTYDNDCIAQSHGVVSWIGGPCP